MHMNRPKIRLITPQVMVGTTARTAREGSSLSRRGSTSRPLHPVRSRLRAVGTLDMRMKMGMDATSTWTNRDISITSRKKNFGNLQQIQRNSSFQKFKLSISSSSISKISIFNLRISNLVNNQNSNSQSLILTFARFPMYNDSILILHFSKSQLLISRIS